MNYRKLLFDKMTEETAKKICEDYGIVDNDKKDEMEKGDSFWFIQPNGCIISGYYFNSNYDKTRKLMNNFFRTKEDANKHLEKLKALKKVKDYIKDNFGVFEPNWEDEEQSKWHISYDIDSGFVGDVNFINGRKDYSPFGYLRSDKNCYQLICDMSGALNIIFER